MALDLPDASFDRVLCQHGLQSFRDRVAVLSGVRRVLAPKGRAVFAAWRGFDKHEVLREMAEIEARHLASVGMSLDGQSLPFSLGDANALSDYFERAGFESIEVNESSFETSFPAEGFIRNMEFGYSAVVPEFAANHQRFDEFVEAVERDAEPLL